MVQAAWAARTKDSYFHAQFVRLKSRRGPKKAIIAVAASMLTAWYHMLRNGVEFHDLGVQYFLHHDKDQITKRLLRRLRDLGVEVESRTLHEPSNRAWGTVSLERVGRETAHDVSNIDKYYICVQARGGPDAW